MFDLREYQEEAVNAGLEYLNGNSEEPGIIVVPCGGGKSIIISYIAKEIRGNVLVLQPTKEILMQNYGKAVSFGATPTIYSASCKKKEISEFTYATLKSIKKDVERLN
jgi:superfamily II DNA or RNA helicase